MDLKKAQSASMGTGAEYAQMRRHRPTMYVDNYHRIFAFSQSDQVQIWYE